MATTKTKQSLFKAIQLIQKQNDYRDRPFTDDIKNQYHETIKKYKPFKDDPDILSNITILYTKCCGIGLFEGPTEYRFYELGVLYIFEYKNQIYYYIAMYDNMELIVHTEVTHNPHQNNNDTYQTFEQYRYKEVADRLIGCKILTQNEINILNFEKEDRIRSRKSYQEFIKWLKIKQNSSTEEFLRELYNILNRNSHYRYQKTADQAKESLELIIKESAEGKI